MDTRILYKELAGTIQARLTCQSSGNTEWLEQHSDRIEQLVADFLPSGSGWDCGTKIDLDESHADKLVFCGGYHHMNESGMYDGWTDHTVTVTPSLVLDFHLRISGRNRNDIKDYLHELFESALHTKLVWNKETQRWMDERYLQKGESQ